MQAASKRILTSKSSNCSTTSSHRDFPEKKKTHTLNVKKKTMRKYFLITKIVRLGNSDHRQVHSPSSAGSSADQTVQTANRGEETLHVRT